MVSVKKVKQRYGDCPVCGKAIVYLGATACSPKCDSKRLVPSEPDPDPELEVEDPELDLKEVCPWLQT